jgi:hypothetical protein
MGGDAIYDNNSDVMDNTPIVSFLETQIISDRLNTLSGLWQYLIEDNPHIQSNPEYESLSHSIGKKILELKNMIN